MMGLKKWFCLAGFLMPMTGFTAIYQWVDSDGVTQFSDQPHDGAKQIQLPPIQTIPDSNSGQQMQPSNSEPMGNPTPSVVSQGYTISVTSPSDKENIPWGIASNLKVQIAVTPTLDAADTIEVLLDGKVEKTGNATEYTFDNLVRGQHTLQAKIVTIVPTTKNSEPQIKELATSASITFYVQQPSLLNPQKPKTGQAKPLSLTPQQMDRVRQVIEAEG